MATKNTAATITLLAALSTPSVIMDAARAQDAPVREAAQRHAAAWEAYYAARTVEALAAADQEIQDARAMLLALR